MIVSNDLDRSARYIALLTLATVNDVLLLRYAIGIFL